MPAVDPEQLLASLPSVNGSSDNTSAYTPGLGVSQAEAKVFEVYTGRNRKPRQRYKTPGGAGDEFAPHGSYEVKSDPVTDNKMPADEAAGQIYKWDDKTLKRWEQKLLENGLIEKGKYSYQDLVGAWQEYVDTAARMYTLGNKKVTPWDVADMDGEITGRKEEKSLAGTHTVTDRDVALTNAGDAKALLTNMLSQHLGRAPKEEEVEDFLSAVNTREMENPRITKTTTTTDEEGNVTDRNSVQTGGLQSGDYQSMGEDFAKNEPDYAGYQASTTYMNALLQALNSPV